MSSTSRRQRPLRHRIVRSDATVWNAERTIERLLWLPSGAVSLRLPDGSDARGDKAIRKLRMDYGWNGASHRAPRFRSLRGDATVRAAERAIEAWFGLPAGSVSLRLPSGRDARGDKTIRNLRRDYGLEN